MPESMSHRRRAEVRAEAQRVVDDSSTAHSAHRALAEATLQVLTDLASTESRLYTFAQNTAGVIKGVSAHAEAAIESIPEYEPEPEQGLSDELREQCEDGIRALRQYGFGHSAEAIEARLDLGADDHFELDIDPGTLDLGLERLRICGYGHLADAIQRAMEQVPCPTA